MHVLYILLAKTRGIKYFNVENWMCFALPYQNFWLRAWTLLNSQLKHKDTCTCVHRRWSGNFCR